MLAVGEFSYSDETSAIEGPAEYLNTRGADLVDAIVNGKDAIFNASFRQSPDYMMAVLNRLQDDYAGWKGVGDFCAAHQIL